MLKRTSFYHMCWAIKNLHHKIRFATFVIPAILTSLLITGCTSFTPAPAPQTMTYYSWAQRKAQLETLKHWQIRGAMAIKNAKQAESISYFWQYAPKHYQLQLFGTLGLGRTILHGTPQGVTLTSASGDRYQARNAQALLAQQTGWQLPVSNLVYWVRGLPAPGQVTRITWDAQHHLSHLTQQKWSIRYLAYTQMQGIDLPSEIELSSGPLFAKLAISSWQISEAE